MQTVDVVVIGAGPAGSVAASGLVRQGRSVVVLEKLRFPRFLIGESLLPRSNEIMEKCGLLGAVEKAGFLKKRGAVFYLGDQREEFDFEKTSTRGWNFAYQTPRSDFDKILADTTANMGADFRYQHLVQDVQFDEEGVTVVCADLAKEKEQTFRARFVVDCSGYGRVLPRLLGLDEQSDLTYRQSLFTHIKNDNRPKGNKEGYIWIVSLSQGGWVWVIPFSNALTSVGVVAEPLTFDGVTGNDSERLKQLLLQEPSLSERLKDMEYVLPVRKIEGYSIGVKKLYGDRYILTGNASEFLDPVFSSGVTLAMESAYKAQELTGRYLNGETVDFEKEYSEYIMQGVNCFRAYVKAWYSGELKWLFFNKDKPPRIKEHICSVLAGYAWDQDNPFATDASGSLQTLVDTLPQKYRF